MEIHALLRNQSRFSIEIGIEPPSRRQFPLEITAANVPDAKIQSILLLLHLFRDEFRTVFAVGHLPIRYQDQNSWSRFERDPGQVSNFLVALCAVTFSNPHFATVNLR